MNSGADVSFLMLLVARRMGELRRAEILARRHRMIKASLRLAYRLCRQRSCSERRDVALDSARQAGYWKMWRNERRQLISEQEVVHTSRLPPVLLAALSQRIIGGAVLVIL
jgi:hypothetical protein